MTFSRSKYFLCAVLLLSFLAGASVSSAQQAPECSPDSEQQKKCEERLTKARDFLRLLGIKNPPELNSESLDKVASALMRLKAAEEPAETPLAPETQTGQDDGSSNNLNVIPEVDLLPRFLRRLAAFATFDLEWTDTPDEIVGRIPVMEDMMNNRPRAGATDEPPPMFMEGLVENPQSYLQRFSFNFDLAQLFPTPAELNAAYAKLSDIKKHFDLDTKKFNRLLGTTSSDDQINGDDRIKRLLHYFGRKRTRDVMARLLASFSTRVSFSERSVTLDNENTVVRGDEFGTTFAVAFNPRRLISRAEDADAHEALLHLAKLAPEILDPEPLDPEKQADLWIARNDLKCLEAKSLKVCADEGISSMGIWMSALLPRVEFRIVDDFDFLRIGGQFPSDRRTETLLLRWNLRPLFERFAPRTSGIRLKKAMKELEQLKCLWRVTLPKEKETTDNPVATVIHVPLGQYFQERLRITENTVNNVVTNCRRPKVRTSQTPTKTGPSAGSVQEREIENKKNEEKEREKKRRKAEELLADRTKWCLAESLASRKCAKSNPLPDNLEITKDGVIQGVIINKPPTDQYTVLFQGEYGPIERRRIRLVHKVDHAALMTDYMYLCLTPSIVLDDDWYEEFKHHWGWILSKKMETSATQETPE